MSLQKNIETIAAEFVAHVLHAIRTASLDDIAAATGRAAPSAKRGPGRPPKAAAAKPVAGKSAKKAGRRGRLPRRSAEDISAALDAIVAAVKAAPNGLRAEEIQAKLGIDKRELPRPIQEGLSAKRLIKKGKKRATTYFAGSKKKG
jgi:hypothetical protein